MPLSKNNFLYPFIIAFLIVFSVFSLDIILISFAIDNLNILTKVIIEESFKFLFVYLFFFKIFNDKVNFIITGVLFGGIELILYLILFYGYGINFILIRYLVFFIHIITFLVLYYALFYIRVKKNILVGLGYFFANILLHYLWNLFSNYIS